MVSRAPLPDRVRLVVLYGGRSAEHDVSCVTAAHVLAAADPARYDVVPVAIDRDGRWRRPPPIDAAPGGHDRPAALTVAGDPIDPAAVLPEPLASGTPPTVVLPLLHGPHGEDGTVQGLLELADVAYVGTGVLGSALAMDKAMAREVLAQAGVPQCRWITLHHAGIGAGTADEVIHDLGLPVFVKPANMGSSIGITKAHDRDELVAALDLAASYDEWLVVEEHVTGREIEIAVLGNLDLQVSVPGEIRPGAEFYDYDDKYHDGAAELLIPAVLPPDIASEIDVLARRTARALRVEGMARVDFFYEAPGRGLLLNEVNTIPGFTPISMYPKLWAASGVGYPALIDALVGLALERWTRRRAHRRTDHAAPRRPR